MEIRKEILDILTKDAKIANRHIAAMLGIEESKSGGRDQGHGG